MRCLSCQTEVANKDAQRHAHIAAVSMAHNLSGAAAVEKAKSLKPELF